MRKAFLVLLIALASVGTAAAHGPSGSEEDENDVGCAKGVRVAQLGTTYYAGANGVEVCKDRHGSLKGTPVSMQGRFIVHFKKRYVTADGERNNSEQARGYARIDRTGLHCSKGDDMDSTHSRTKGESDSCDGGY